MVRFRNLGIKGQRGFQASKHNYFIDDNWFEVKDEEDIRFFRLNGSFEEEGKPSPVPEAVIKVEPSAEISVEPKVEHIRKKRILGHEIG